MAGPHVSAVVLLLRQVQSDLSVDEIQQILIETAKPLTDQQFPESPNNGYGAGLVDAREAITALTNGIGTIEGQVTKEGEDTEPPVFHIKVRMKFYCNANPIDHHCRRWDSSDKCFFDLPSRSR